MRPQPPQRDNSARFQGKLRHYHRSGVPKTQSWNEWVYGRGAKSVSMRKWLKLAGIILSLLALGGIVVGLFMELR